MKLTDEQQAFVFELEQVQKLTHQINRDNGFWKSLESIAALGEQERVLMLLSRNALIDSEIAEASEALRKHDPATWNKSDVKDTLVREYAGAVVRIMDMAEWLNLPLGEAILAELANNATRGVMHGGKKA